MDKHEMIDLLEEAQESMREALDKIRQYCRESGDRHTEAYIAARLAIMIDSDHGYLANDANLGDVIHELMHGEDED